MGGGNMRLLAQVDELRTAITNSLSIVLKKPTW
jgi:hypothetical protein